MPKYSQGTLDSTLDSNYHECRYKQERYNDFRSYSGECLQYSSTKEVRLFFSSA